MEFYKVIDGFRDAMRAAGIPFSGDIQVDKFTRFDIDGERRGALSGWYILHGDGIPAGEFGSWKSGVSSTWYSKDPKELTQDERQAIEARRIASEKQRQADQAAQYADAEKRAATIWGQAVDCIDHEYLIAKGVQAHGLRVGDWPLFDGSVIQNALLIPVLMGKKLVSLQAIFPDANNPLTRSKTFLKGGQKRGAYFKIGDIKKDDERPVLIICEGYATGASIFEATGYCVLVAFDAGNIEPVAEKIKKLKPFSTVIIAADNDQFTTTPINNPGVHYAKQAGARCRCYVAVPEFEPGDLDNKPTDFNDLGVLYGPQLIRDAINRALPKPAAIVQQATSQAPTVKQQGPTAQTVDYYSPLPDVKEKGAPLSTIENLAAIMDRLGVTVRYNVIKKDEEILIPGESFSIDNAASASVAWVKSWCARFRMPTDRVGDYLTYLADQNLYNPVTTWITSTPWDGVSRLQALYNTVRVVGDDQSTKEIILRRWFLSAIAAAFEPQGISAHGVLVFQGAQYLGKTAWFKSLVPSSLDVIADGLLLKPDDKDSVKQVVSNWLVELGELDATFRKSDLAQLKSFLTKDRDIIRRAYAARESVYARRTVFFGSVNPKEFLHDNTGNRRYWTLEAEAIEHNHGLPMQQVWSEVYETIYKTGEKWFLLPDEMERLNRSNKDFEVNDPVEELIRSRFDWNQGTAFWTWKTSTDILQAVGIEKPTQSEATRCAHIVRQLNGNQGRRVSNGRQLLIPPKLVERF